MRILVADDDPVIALGLARRLVRMGHEPLGPAYDGRQAVQLAHDEQPDLCLFDIDMPQLDGLSAAEVLAREGLRRPVVVITGVRDANLIDRSIATGVSGYLTKPIDDVALRAAIDLAAARHAELLALETEVDRARQALADRKVVERAKGILIDSLGLAETEALSRIRRAARNRNVRLVDVAREIVQHSDVLGQARRSRTSPDETT